MSGARGGPAEGPRRFEVDTWIVPRDGGPAKPDMPWGSIETIDGRWFLPTGEEVVPVRPGEGGAPPP